MSNRSIRENERTAAAKKAAQRRKRRRKKRAIALLSFFLILCVITLVVLCFTVFFKIETISVSGDTRYTQDQIILASGVGIDQNLLLLNDRQIVERIQTALPYIDSVKMRRKLPTSLELTVTEATDELCLLSSGSYYTATRTGKVLSVCEEQPTSLMLVRLSDEAQLQSGYELVYGSNNEKELLARYLTLEENYGVQINTIDLTDVYDSYIKIENRFIVKFGSTLDFELKAAHLNAMLKKMSSDKQGIIDLSGWTQQKPEAFFTERSIQNYE